MAHITHTVTIKDKNGNDSSHTSEAVEFKDLADGAVSVRATCCSDDGTGSWHTFYDTGKMSESDITAEVSGHVQRVAEGHAARSNARQHLVSLVKPTSQQ